MVEHRNPPSVDDIIWPILDSNDLLLCKSRNGHVDDSRAQAPSSAIEDCKVIAQQGGIPSFSDVADGSKRASNLLTFPSAPCSDTWVVALSHLVPWKPAEFCSASRSNSGPSKMFMLCPMSLINEWPNRYGLLWSIARILRPSSTQTNSRVIVSFVFRRFTMGGGFCLKMQRGNIFSLRNNISLLQLETRKFSWFVCSLELSRSMKKV